MKALSVRQPWAALIASGVKTIELRTRPTKYRGQLLICASQHKDPVHNALPRGVAVCIVEVVDCRSMLPSDSANACSEYNPKNYSWIVRLVRTVEAFPVNIPNAI